jgi:2',3'-cyclic-nucleotide 2'-phosphodiesterase (5'-nucleotidase family)
MIERLLFIIGLLPSVALSAQPSAPKPVAAPMRDLPWGQLNFLATTDTHGWHGGHLQEYIIIFAFKLLR